MKRSASTEKRKGRVLLCGATQVPTSICKSWKHFTVGHFVGVGEGDVNTVPCVIVRHNKKYRGIQRITGKWVRTTEARTSFARQCYEILRHIKQVKSRHHHTGKEFRGSLENDWYPEAYNGSNAWYNVLFNKSSITNQAWVERKQ